MSARLDAVSKTKQAYMMAKTTLEQRLREQMREELANLQTQLDIAIRYAVDSGESKADILRALGTTSYNTVYESLSRTSGVAEVVGNDPLDGTYQLDGDILHVVYDSHGPSQYSGYADFQIKSLDTGRIMLLSLSPLYSEDYSVRNDVVASLDQKTEGFYFDEVCEWLKSKDYA
jgi:hypothetical protein